MLWLWFRFDFESRPTASQTAPPIQLCTRPSIVVKVVPQVPLPSPASTLTHCCARLCRGWFPTGSLSSPYTLPPASAVIRLASPRLTRTSITSSQPPTMPVSVELNTPLADALNSAIQPKLEQYGWATGGADDAALTEYIILMLVNGKTQEEVTRELSTDLLGLDPNDSGLLEFSNWLFATIDALSAQFGSNDAQADATSSAAPAGSGVPDDDQDMDMSTNDGIAEFNVYVTHWSSRKYQA